MMSAYIRGGIVVAAWLSCLHSFAVSQNRIYIANDDHTDYMWSADEATYREAFIGQLDYYLGRIEATSLEQSKNQARFSTDGTFWLWEYEKNKTPGEFESLMNRVKDGHIGVPINPLILVYGAQPAESVIRGMYYAGDLERRFGVRFTTVTAMEDQTLPFGVVTLWAGAGVKYCYHGQCGCASKVPNPFAERPHEMYWWTGLDGSRILTKWYRLESNQGLGGYAELHQNNGSSIDLTPLREKQNTASYPYGIVAGIGRGWDYVYPQEPAYTQTTVFETVAKNNSDAICSNREDFFVDFEASYGNNLPEYGASFGNEWDLLPASLAEVSAGVKRAVEKLRAAEAMASMVSLQSPSFMDGRKSDRDQAWMSLGLFWEHDWTADGSVSRDARETFERERLQSIENYVDSLWNESVAALAGMIKKNGTNLRFFAFNPLSWTRADIAEIFYDGSATIHVVDVESGEEVPSQIVNVAAGRRLRILAKDVPAVGYRVFEVVPGSGQAFSDAATVTAGVTGTLENQFYRIEFQNSGTITSIIDKQRSSREFVQSAINALGTGTGSVSEENAGPVTATLVANGSNPRHTTRLTLIRDSDRIDIQNQISETPQGVFRWSYGFNLTSPDVWHEEVGAVIRARTLDQVGHYCPDTNITRYDWLTLNHFFDMTGTGPVGVTLSNADCLFMQLGNSSVGFLDTNTPTIKVLGGGQVDGGSLGIQNQGGDSNFLQRFALRTHDGFSEAGAMKFALEHQNPFVASVIPGGTSLSESHQSLFQVSNPEVLIWAVKPAEEGVSTAGIVVRLWNLGESSSFTLSMPGRSIVAAERVSHVETPLVAAQLNQGALSSPIEANQLLTFSIRSSASAADTVPPESPGNLNLVIK